MPQFSAFSLGNWGPWLVDCRQARQVTVNMYWPDWNQTAAFMFAGVPEDHAPLILADDDNGLLVAQFAIRPRESDFTDEFPIPKTSFIFGRHNFWCPYLAISLQTLAYLGQVTGQVSFDVLIRR